MCIMSHWLEQDFENHSEKSSLVESDQQNLNLLLAEMLLVLWYYCPTYMFTGRYSVRT